MTSKGPSTLPAKLYFRIGEVADLVGVEPHVLRYWEREFRTIRPSKSAKGQRVYSRRDVENLFRVRELLYTQGFTIAGARKRMQKPGDDLDDAPVDAELATASAAGFDPLFLDATPDTHRAPPALHARAPRAHAYTPAPPPPQPSQGPRTVEKLHVQLVALRAEVAAFLDELSPR